MHDEVRVLEHSSIKISGSKTVYFDPFHIVGEPHDADIIFVTHEHYDHFSPEDIVKIKKDTTILVLPGAMEGKEQQVGFDEETTVYMEPEEETFVAGLVVEAVAAYNKWKPFHPKKNRWIGYVLTMDGTRYYVPGDTDLTSEAKKVECDVAIVPVGGKFTMDPKDAAKLVNTIKPKLAIPSHYGSIVGKAEDGDEFISLVDPVIESRK